MGLLSLSYTRPKHVDRKGSGSLSDAESQGSQESGRSGYSSGIPDSLAFDNIMSGGTCPVGPPLQTCVSYAAY